MSIMNNDWRPTANWQDLQLRAQIIRRIRNFFYQRQVLEVDTPLMAPASVTTPAIESITTRYAVNQTEYTLYLQTSPEFYMKRLLAAGSGPIFQICKAFRHGEIGRLHNPEFTMLEWYRPGFNHHDLMDEMAELFQMLLPISNVKRVSYEAIFNEVLGINPHIATVNQLASIAHRQHLSVQGLDVSDRDSWLDVLLTHCIEPTLSGLTFIYDFPASQAALAQIRHGDYPIAERFEAYIDTIELANGFHELADANEQKARFEQELLERQQLGLSNVPIDYALLNALAADFPDCAGVAVGIDRLVMLIARQQSLSSVMSFVTEFSF